MQLITKTKEHPIMRYPWKKTIMVIQIILIAVKLFIIRKVFKASKKEPYVA